MTPLWEADLRVAAGTFSLHVNFQTEARVVALFGASGSGKSTLIEALAGVRPCEGGFTLGKKRLPHHDFRVGWVPQDAALFPHMHVEDNVNYACQNHEAAERAIEVLGLAFLRYRFPSELSGGERQRVALARALAAEPEVLLLDEPLSGVDLPRRASVFQFLLKVKDEFQIPILYVSHDPSEVLAIADHVVLLDQGRVLGQGAPKELLSQASALRFLDRLGFENVFRVSFPASEPGHAVIVETEQGQTLVAPSPPKATDGGTGWLAVRAEDVLLANSKPQGLSARNILRGEIRAMEETEHNLLLRIRSGEDWVASLTRRAVQELDLSVGSSVWVIAKTHSLHWLAE